MGKALLLLQWENGQQKDVTVVQLQKKGTRGIEREIKGYTVQQSYTNKG